MESKPNVVVNIDNFKTSFDKLASNAALDEELRKRCDKASQSILTLKKALKEEELATIMRIPSILLGKVTEQIQSPEISAIKDIFESVVVLPLKQVLDLVDAYADILPHIAPEDLRPIMESCSIDKFGWKFTNQRVYRCETCKLDKPKMLCQSCADICHKDHNTIYVMESPGICDCRFEKTSCKLTKCCSKVYTGANFRVQPRFSCKTCNISGTHGICDHCARKCHVGHEVQFEGIVSHYCDCSSLNKCKSTKLP